MKPEMPAKRPTKTGDSQLRVKWSGSLVFAGPYPEPAKRFYKLETLCNAIEKGLNEKDRFLYGGLLEVLDGAKPASFSGDLVFEDPIRLLFALNVTGKEGKQVHLYLAVAKSHEEHSASLEQEYYALCRLSEQAPRNVIRPVKPGLIYLPDRHQRREVNREIFACLYKMPPQSFPLYAASPAQFGPRGPEPKRYSNAESEKVKMAIIRLMAKCYDEAAFQGIIPESLAPESFWMRQSHGGVRELVLASCRCLEKRLRSGQLVGKLLFGTLSSGRNTLAIAPVRPDHFWEALAEAITPPKAAEWCLAFLGNKKACEKMLHTKRQVPMPGKEYLAVLESYARSNDARDTDNE